MSRSLLWALILQGVLSLAANAQADKSTLYDPDLCGNLTTASQCVANNFALNHIPLTRDGLMSTLHGEDISLRNLAIYELAEGGVKDAIPDLLALLDTETDPNKRMCLADALAKLGDERGVQTLQSYRDDRSVSMGDRLQAADRLLRYQPRSCPRTLIEGLQNETFRVQALGLIWRFKKLTPSESSQVRALLLNSLQDNNSDVRWQAAETILGLGDASLVPPLQIAMAGESNSSVREAMGYAIEAIQKKSRSGTSQAPR